jgi:4-amino-4-deoxy-L-arabinose transferase-like glycosyltransferase
MRHEGGAPLALVVAVCLVVAIAVTFVPVSTSNPPAFYRDESGIALNAALLAESGRDEFGTRLPLYFRSYGDWKSAPYVYLLAGVYAITGPSEVAARALSSALGLAAVVILGLLGHRLSGYRSVGLATAALAAATPWLFELTRLVFEVALEPALISLLLLLLAGVRSEAIWSPWRCAAIGVTLALIAYAYAGGRALAPLLALSLLVFARGRRRRSVVVTLGCFGAALLPMAAFVVGNPRALIVRYSRVSEGEDQGPLGRGLSTLGNLLQELNLVRWVLQGDDNLRHHVGSTGSLLATGALLAVVGIVVLLRRHRWEPFWSYVVLGCVSSAVPAAISDVRIHALRSVGLPIFLITLAVPALALVRERIDRRAVRFVAVVAGALLAIQATLFRVEYADRGPHRLEAFHAEFRPVLRAAMAHDARRVVVFRADPDAMGNAVWYGKLWKPSGHRAPRGCVAAARQRRRGRREALPTM